MRKIRVGTTAKYWSHVVLLVLFWEKRDYTTVFTGWEFGVYPFWIIPSQCGRFELCKQVKLTDHTKYRSKVKLIRKNHVSILKILAMTLGKITVYLKVLGYTSVENKLMIYFTLPSWLKRKSILTAGAVEAQPQAMHSALYIDRSRRNPSVWIPVQQQCEKINGMWSPRGDIQYLLWSVNLVWYGMKNVKGRGRQIDKRRIGPIKTCQGEILASNWQLQAKFRANFENMHWWTTKG